MKSAHARLAALLTTYLRGPPSINYVGTNNFVTLKKNNNTLQQTIGSQFNLSHAYNQRADTWSVTLSSMLIVSAIAEQCHR